MIKYKKYEIKILNHYLELIPYKFFKTYMLKNKNKYSISPVLKSCNVFPTEGLNTLLSVFILIQVIYRKNHN